MAEIPRGARSTWTTAARQVPCRSGKSCKYRWSNSGVRFGRCVCIDWQEKRRVPGTFCFEIRCSEAMDSVPCRWIRRTSGSTIDTRRTGVQGRNTIRLGQAHVCFTETRDLVIWWWWRPSGELCLSGWYADPKTSIRHGEREGWLDAAAIESTVVPDSHAVTASGPRAIRIRRGRSH